MPTLLIRLVGPMQSWGVESKFDRRDTATEPTKSGVLGLLCAACGIERTDWKKLKPLTRLHFGVRVNKPGVLQRDFQTAHLHPGDPKSDTAIARKFYLADADFLAGLESEDLELLHTLHSALRDPVFALCLGRKSYPPSRPFGLRKVSGPKVF